MIKSTLVSIMLLFLVVSQPVYAAPSVDLDISIGSLVGPSIPASPRGQIPAWFQVEVNIPVTSWLEMDFIPAGHRSNVDRNGDEYSCNYVGLGGTAYAWLFYGKISASKCQFKDDDTSRGDAIYRAEFGVQQGPFRIGLFETQTEGNSYKILGIKAGYTLNLFK